MSSTAAVDTGSFIHLHVHSDYSLLDGACRVDKLVARAVELGMPALAVTDHGNLFGAVDFYKTAKKAGIKPIIGSEVYITDLELDQKEKSSLFHLTLLVKNKVGYQNLIRLNTIAQKDGFYYKPRLNKKVLRKYSEGLIALSGCLQGELSQALLSQRGKDRVDEILDEYLEIFGKENFFIEVHRHGLEEEKAAEEGLVKLAADRGLRIVGANDVHYIRKEDAFAHEVLLCIQTGSTLADENRMRFSVNEFHLKSSEEMAELYWDLPEAIETTRIIADMCDFDIEFGQNLLPRYDPPDGKSPEDYLVELCQQGLERRYPEITPELQERLDYEIGVIKNMGFVAYFLIVWEFINYARESNIPVGPGRGSAAGSIVAYCLGITNIDPMAYGLLFERFLNPERISMPDIDIDFCYNKREQVIQHVIKRYGRDQVAQIITFGTLGAKAVVRDVGRVLGMTYSEVDAIAKLIPAELNITLEKSLKEEPELTRACENSSQVQKLFDIALTLEGLVRNISTHAAGIVIAGRPLTETVPLARSANGELCTQYPKDDIEEIGLLKMDFLGLRTLTVIDECLEIIKRVRDVTIDLDNLDLTDRKTYEMLRNGNSVGVFQLESGGMRDSLMKMEIDCFDDLQSVIALYRPGPMKFIPDYIARKKGEEAVEYDHPLLEEVVKSTYGIMVYQEQVMKCANVIGGYSMGAADKLRKIMGKKIVSQMDQQKDIFIEGAVKNGIDRAIAKKIFETMSYFAGYGFNKSHSAAYAMVSFQTAYLKANYPVEFMAALMSNEMNNPDKLTRLLSECKEMGIKILPPDVNENFSGFTVVGDDAIRFGSSAIKNVGVGASEKMIEERLKGGNFKDMVDFIKRVDSRVINRKVMESMIRSGCFDCMHENRRALLEGLDQLLALATQFQRDRDQGQSSLFDMFQDDDQFQQESFTPPNVEPWDKKEILKIEKELLGFFISGHPLDEYSFFLKNTCNCFASNIEDMEAKAKARAGGIIQSIRSLVTKRTGDKMATLVLEDNTGTMQVVVYPKTYAECMDKLTDGAAILVMGDISDRDSGTLMANKILALDDVFKAISSITINIPDELFDNGKFDEIVTAINNYKGLVPMFFMVGIDSDRKAIIRSGQDFGVSPGKGLFRELGKVLNAKDVALKLNLPANENGRERNGNKFNKYKKKAGAA